MENLADFILAKVARTSCPTCGATSLVLIAHSHTAEWTVDPQGSKLPVITGDNFNLFRPKGGWNGKCSNLFCLSVGAELDLSDLGLEANERRILDTFFRYPNSGDCLAFFAFLFTGILT